ncbi:hypothetical protein L5M43_06305 [Shewanella sp. SW36]|uniref:hypothetical protein n=1 Tax=unclassified Shewanella TaxID=196818 RepID=UPI0021D7D487|nr:MULTISPECIES: hypothetical protein [unclassified Shewanella]MCU7974891.1 hypothetical protein [Shewanella sp. SW36]MCU7990280.1 hypothetical protein [Shewanella sp. SW1]MCU8052738.1 hypothetical protein [Shewanella sp. SM43]
MARKTLKITPEQIQSLRLKAGLTQKQAAEVVHVSIRQWQKFEEAETSGTHVRIGDATLELFCLKTGLSYPPQFSDGYHHGKVISFAGGAGGMARSSLTRDMAILLASDGYDVLVIVSEKYSQLKAAEKLFTYSNQPYPKILYEEDINWNGHSYYKSSFAEIIKHYDFIFFDLETGVRHLVANHFPIDLVITPGRPYDRFDVSVANSRTLRMRQKEGLFEKSSTKLAFLLIDVKTDYVFNFSSYVGDNFSDDLIEEALYYPNIYRKRYSEELATLYELEQEGVYVFNAYTTATYDYYSYLTIDKHKGNEVVMHYLDNPNTIAAHDLRSIKKEMLTLLGVNNDK